MQVCFDFLQAVYGMFGFKFSLKLSTRPEKFLGKITTWDKAEDVRLSSSPPLSAKTDENMRR